MLDRITIMWAFAVLSGPALAAPVVPPSIDAGAAQQRNEQMREYQQRREDSVWPQTPQNPILNTPADVDGDGNASDGPRFKLSKVVFNESSFLNAETLQSITAPYVGRSVHVGALREIVSRINRYYVEHDIYTAKAILPQQTIVDGVVHIQLVEGKLGKQIIQGNDYTHDDFILSRVGQTEGEVVDGARLKHDIVYFNRTTDTQVRALMRPGEKPGLTQILLLAQEPSRYYVSAFTDNYGAESTGRYRGGASIRMSSLFGIDDHLDGYFAGSEGELSGFASYSLPVNRRNGRLGLSYSRNAIDIVRGPFESLDISGHSTNLALNFTQPLLATQRWMVTWASSVSRSKSTTEASHVRLASSTTEQYSMGLTLQETMPYRRWSLTPTISNIHSREELDGRHDFLVYRLQGIYIQNFGDSPYSMLLALGGQHSTNDINPSQALFQIGGVNSIRGYDQGVIAGKSGYYGQIELHRRVGSAVDGFVFFDGGQVREDIPSTNHIESAGLGFSANYQN